MLKDNQPALTPMLRKLQLWKQLDATEAQAILALPHELRTFERDAYLVRERQKVDHSCLLISGFAFRQKIGRNGARSINAVHMQGDIVDLQNSLLGYADHSVQVLSRAEVAYIPRKAIVDLAFRMPNVGMAMWYDTLVDGSVFREWILNIARRSGEKRIAHLLCEFGVRLESLGLGSRSSYQFPMTQEQLADATGLTPVHVNRSLKGLEKRGLISRAMRHVTVGDWEKLRRAGDFDDAYLHLEHAEPSSV